jgi:cytochrome b/b6/petD-like protein
MKLVKLLREHLLIVIPQVVLGAILVWSLINPNARLLVTKPDNVPIVGMLFLVAFYFAYGWEQAFINDRRVKAGLKPLPVPGPDDDPRRHPELLQTTEAAEGRKLVKGGDTSTAGGKDTEDKVLVWPDLAGREFVSAIICFFILMAWSLLLNAPLEEASEPSLTPNPSKAPWYFLGLQEILVYFDPWIAGVLIPSLIIIGLMAIPYVDFNTKSTGYYSIKERKLAFSIFTFGFLMWLTTILIGTFLRGPGYTIYWPWESWKSVKPAETALSIWPAWRGIVFLLAYFGIGFAAPALLAKKFYNQLGPVRYLVTMFFILTMFSVPVKIILRQLFSVKYVLQTPWFAI